MGDTSEEQGCLVGDTSEEQGCTRTLSLQLERALAPTVLPVSPVTASIERSCWLGVCRGVGGRRSAVSFASNKIAAEIYLLSVSHLQRKSLDELPPIRLARG